MEGLNIEKGNNKKAKTKRENENEGGGSEGGGWIKVGQSVG